MLPLCFAIKLARRIARSGADAEVELRNPSQLGKPSPTPAAAADRCSALTTTLLLVVVCFGSPSWMAG